MILFEIPDDKTMSENLSKRSTGPRDRSYEALIRCGFKFIKIKITSKTILWNLVDLSENWLFLVHTFSYIVIVGLETTYIYIEDKRAAINTNFLRELFSRVSLRIVITSTFFYHKLLPPRFQWYETSIRIFSTFEGFKTSSSGLFLISWISDLNCCPSASISL